jgi:hypothetical protein
MVYSFYTRKDIGVENELYVIHILQLILLYIHALDWMELAQDRDRWWALVSTVKKLCVP